MNTVIIIAAIICLIGIGIGTYILSTEKTPKESPFYDPTYVSEEELRANKDIIEEATKHLR